MTRWFEKCISFFPAGILMEIEMAFIHEIHSDNNFKLKFERCSLRDLSGLISFFKEYGRDFFVLYLSEICFENDLRRIREAYANNRKVVERFISIIGKDQFAAFVQKNATSSFQKELQELVPKKTEF